jgi:amino acid adenylation domain-containing protein
MRSADFGARLARMSAGQRELFLSSLAGSASWSQLEFEYPAESTEAAPLSFAQERLWLAVQVADQGARYNTAFSLRIEGHLNIAAFAGAIRLVTDRHAILRTVYDSSDGRPVQSITSGEPLPLRVADLSGLVGAAAGTRQLIRQWISRPFDLARSVFRVLIVREAAANYSIAIALHHIASDRWSADLLRQELMAAYTARVAGRLPDLRPLPMGYADFARWQRHMASAGRFERQLQYWKEILRNPPGPLKWSRELATIESKQPAVRRVRRVLGEADVAMVTRAGAAAAATPFMTLLAVYAVLLREWSGCRDFIVGTPIAYRPSTGLQQLIGFFLNTLLLRLEVDCTRSFSELLAGVRERSLGAFDNSDAPVELVVERCALPRRAQDGLPFQAAFTLNELKSTDAPELARHTAQAAGARVSGEPMEAAEAVGEFTLHIDYRPGGAVCSFDTDPAIFSEAAAERMADAYCEWVRLLLADAARPVAESIRAWKLNSLPPASSRAATETAAGLDSLFRKQVALHPAAIALECDQDLLTYAELDARAGRVARALSALRLEPETLVAVLLPRSCAFVEVVLGVVRAGCAYVPIDQRLPAQRVEAMLSSFGIRTLVTRSALDMNLPPGVERIDVDRLPPDEGTAPKVESSSSGGQLTYVMFTSGSTGAPKGVMVEARSIIRLVIEPDYVELGAGQRVAAVANVAFDASTFEIWGALLNGATLAIHTGEVTDLAGFGKFLLDKRCSVLFLTTAIFNQIARTHAELLAPLECVLFGGEACDSSAALEVHSRMTRGHLVHVYGPTENTTFSTAHEVERDDFARPTLPIGRAISGTHLHILDEQLEPVPLGAVGELYVGGSGLSRGYSGQPHLTAERFIPDPFATLTGTRLYKTGDLCAWTLDGRVSFYGRTDSQIKLRGNRIEPGEIEAALRVLFPQREVAVVPYEGRDGRPEGLAAYVEGAGGFDAADTRRRLGQVLPEYMVPTRYLAVERFPVNANGKISRAALASLPASPVIAVNVVPATPLETALVRIWSEVLGIESVSVESTFLEAGGNSISGMEVVARSKKELRRPVSIRDLLAAESLRSLALQLESRVPAVTMSSPPTMAAVGSINEPFPLTEMQQAYLLGRGNFADLGGTAAQAYYEIEIGDLDIPRFSAALNRTIARHDATRTVIGTDGLQRVLEQVPRFPLPVADLSALSAERANAAIETIRGRMCAGSCAAHRWPLFDFRLTRHGARVRIHASIDALVGDAWSWRVFVSDLLRLYHAPGQALPPLGISFREYVLQNEREKSLGDYLDAKRYWQDRLAAFPGPPPLPLARVQRASNVFNRRSMQLEESQWHALREAGKRQGLTAACMVLSVYADVIARWCNSRHFCINLTLFNRPPVHPQITSIMGDFTSVLLLEVRHDQDSFRTRSAALQRQLMEDLERRAYGGVSVARDLRVLHRNPALIYPVVFTSLIGLPGPTLSGPEVASRLVFSESRTPQVWLDCQVHEDSHGRLCVNWDARDVFPEGMLDAMFAAFTAGLHALVESDERSVLEAQCAATPRPAQAPVAVTSRPASRSLHAPFIDWVRVQPDAPALVTIDRRFSYLEMAQRMTAVRNALARHGVPRGALVPVLMQKGWEQVAAVLGVLHAGCAYLPIAAELPRARIEYLLAQASTRVVLTQGWLGALPLPEQAIRIDVDLLAPCPEIESGAYQCDVTDELAYVIHTSGSTGLPKGVMIPHGGAANTIDDVNARLALSPDDRVLAISSLSFDLSVYDIFGTFAAGACIVMPRPGDDAQHWLELIDKHRVTVWNSVPALANLLMHRASGDIQLARSLRAVMLSGDWIGLRLAADILERLPHARLISLGGATEASIWSIWYDVDAVRPEWSSVPYGYSLANQRVRVLGFDSIECPVWVAGELYIEGAGVAAGYLHDEKKTRERFLDAPDSGAPMYRTGDLGRYLPDGSIEFLGRNDNQVKVNGYRIELEEIESAFYRCPGVAEVHVLADARGPEVLLVAFVRCEPGAVVDEVELRRLLREQLPEYMIPARLAWRDGFPLTANGKLDRVALLESQQDAPAAGAVDQAPASEMELQISAIFASELGLPRVGCDQDLFSLGGHSLVGAKIATEIWNRYGVRVSLRDIFGRPTPRKLAELLNERFASGEPIKQVTAFVSGTL